MTKHRIFFSIYSATMSPCSLAPGECERAQSTWLCSGCNGIRPGYRSIDVRLESPEILFKPLTYVSGGFPGLILKSLLEPIDPAILQRDLYFGRVFRENGELIDAWATYHGRYSLIVRGTENVSERICSECGQLVYFASDKRYLHPPPPDDVDVFESDVGLIFTEQQFKKLDIGKWRKRVYIDTLRVECPSGSTCGSRDSSSAEDHIPDN